MKKEMIFAMSLLILMSLFAGCGNIGSETKILESVPVDSNTVDIVEPQEDAATTDPTNEEVIAKVISGENIISADAGTEQVKASDAPQNTNDVKKDKPSAEAEKKSNMPKETTDREEKPSSKPASTAKPKPTEAPESAPTPTTAPKPTTETSQESKGNAQAVDSGFCKSIFNEINEIRISQGYPAAKWDGGLKGKAQGWADSLIEQSIKKNKYTHYHDNNRDSSEGIFWITDGKTSAKSIADQVAAHCPACISSTEVIGIGGTIWENCPIGDDMGFIVVRFYS